MRSFLVRSAFAVLALSLACATPPPPSEATTTSAAARTDPREFAPNPYSVEELRAACTGRSLRLHIEKAGAPPVDQDWKFTDATQESVTLTIRTFDMSGAELGPPSVEKTLWLELHSHGDFPRADTVVGEEAIDGPAGPIAVKKYVIARGDEVRTLWFDKALAGPPAKMVVTQAGARVLEMHIVHN